MIYSPRDRAVVELVAAFGQASAPQLARIFFPDLDPKRPNTRLRRLVALGYLARLPGRLTTGPAGGAGPYVYGLGREGHALYGEGRYSLPLIHEHTLATVSTYEVCVLRDRAGDIRLTDYKVEPRLQVGSIVLSPDMAVRIERLSGQVQPYFFEVERTIKSQRRIKEKLDRYWSAYCQADAQRWPQWPPVVFMAFDAVRPDELKRLVAQLPAERRVLFRVATLETLRTAEL